MLKLLKLTESVTFNVNKLTAMFHETWSNEI